MLQRRTSLRRSAFRRNEGPTPMARARFWKKDGPSVPASERPLAQIRPLAVVPNYGGSCSGVPVVKERASQHSGYMAAVRDLGYCMLCKRCCRPQFCHADMGKGERIKTDVRRGWPGCPECHWLVGTSGHYPKQERRELESILGWRTRQAVIAAGTWPPRLQMWKEE